MVWKRQRGRTDRRATDGFAVAAPAALAGSDSSDGPDGSDGSADHGGQSVSPISDPTFLSGLRPIPTGGSGQPWPAADIVGITPAGEPRRVSVDSFAGPLLVVFLTTNCDGCEGFWDGLRDDAESTLPDGVDVIIVTKGETVVSPLAVAQVAVGVDRVPVVMSDQAWSDYHVLGYPFFVLVDAPTRAIVAETVGFGWADVAALLA
jgi:hypothetical protein